jgi:hypothetical protein
MLDLSKLLYYVCHNTTQQSTCVLGANNIEQNQTQESTLLPCTQYPMTRVNRIPILLDNR